MMIVIIMTAMAIMRIIIMITVNRIAMINYGDHSSYESTLKNSFEHWGPTKGFPSKIMIITDRL